MGSNGHQLLVTIQPPQGEDEDEGGPVRVCTPSGHSGSGRSLTEFFSRLTRAVSPSRSKSPHRRASHQPTTTTASSSSTLLAPGGPGGGSSAVHLQVPAPQFRTRSKSLDDGTRNHLALPTVTSTSPRFAPDCETTYRIYNQILKEGRSQLGHSPVERCSGFGSAVQ
jgi:hypothetical protein